MTSLIDNLPAPPDKPITEWSTPELLLADARVGLQQLHRILSQPIKVKETSGDTLSPEDLKLQRLIGDLALGVDKLLARVAEGDLRRIHNEDLLTVLKERITRAEAKRAKGGENTIEASL